MKFRMAQFLVGGALTLASCSVLYAQTTQTTSPQDAKWLTYAAHDNQGEIQICLLAEKRAQNPAGKAFARLMVDDHVQIESELAAVKPNEATSLPNDVGEDAGKTLSRLEGLHGAAFDRAFIEAQIKDHSNDLQKFAAEEASTKDPDIRRFALLTSPVLQQHLALAKAVAQQLDAD